MASAASSIQRSDGTVRAMHFVIATDAAASAVTVSVGFKPLHLRVVNTTDSSIDEAFNGGSKINTAGAGAAASAASMDQSANTVSVTMANNKAAFVSVYG